MFNYALKIKYIGTNYHGWQKQKNQISIQEVLEKNIDKFLHERIKLIGSGRTDAGVHALGQVANFKTKKHIKPDSLKKYLNAVLPRDISVVNVKQVPITFNSRFDAKGKTYLYRLYTEPDPFLYMRGWYIYKSLNLEKLESGLDIIKNSNNLISLAKRGEYLREDIEIRGIKISFKGHIIDIEITASHFLRYMVRKIIGHVVNVGLGYLSLDELEDIIQKADPSAGKFLAPPEGLYLKEVHYIDLKI